MMIAKNAAFNCATKAKAVFALLATTSLVGCTGGLGDALKDIKGDEKTTPSVGAVSAKFEKESGARFKVLSNKIMVPVRFPVSVDPSTVDVDAFKVSGCEDAILNDVQIAPFDLEKDKNFQAFAEIDVPVGSCTAKSINVELDLSKVRTVSTDEVEAKAGRGTLKASYFTDNEGPVIKEIHVGARKFNFMEMKALGGPQTDFGFDVNDTPESVTFVFEDTDIDWKSVVRGAVTIAPAGGGFGCAKPPVPGSPIKNINSNSFTVPLSREECGMDTQIEVKVDLTRLVDLSENGGAGTQAVTITRALTNIAVASVELKDVERKSAGPEYLKKDDEATILVTFDAAVKTGAAAPKLSLKVGAGNAQTADCTIQGGLTGKVLECVYTVADGQNGALDYDLAGTIEGLEPAIDAQIGGKDRTVLTALPQSGDLAGKVVVDTTAPTGAFEGLPAKIGQAATSLKIKMAEEVKATTGGIGVTVDGCTGLPTTATAEVDSNDATLVNVSLGANTCATGEKFTVTLDADSVEDLAGNTNAAIVSADIEVDATVPTVNVAPNATTPINKDGELDFTVTYADAKTITLTEANISVTGGTIADCVFTVSGTGDTARTVKVSGCTGDGAATLEIAAGTATSEYGQTAASTTATFTVDNTAPTGTPVNIAEAVAIEDAEITVEFDEDIVLATTPTVQICNDQATPACVDHAVAAHGTDADKVTVTLSGALTEGDYTIKFTGVTDAAGNAAEDVELKVELTP